MNWIAHQGGLAYSCHAADQWGNGVLISKEAFENFRNQGDYSAQSVKHFAEDQGIAPGIVVGRMQQERMIKHSMLNDLKDKYLIAYTS